MRSTDINQILPSIKGMFLRPSKTKSMTFGRSKTVSNILIRCSIVSDEINTFCDFVDFVENLWNQTQTQKVFISSEAMRHGMSVFDVLLEHPKVILLVSESHRNILEMLGNTWSTFVVLIVD